MERGGEVILPSGGHWRWRDFWLLQLGGGPVLLHLKPSDAVNILHYPARLPPLSTNHYLSPNVSSV